MIDYFEKLMPEEQEEVRMAVDLLYRQTFVLERKFDRKTGRMQFNREFRICTRHLEFLRAYFNIAGIAVEENIQTGIIYLQKEILVGEKLSKLTTLYVLILKLIYDEQMAAASTSVHILTTLAEMNERLASFRLITKLPAVTDMRRAIALLKRYQVIEPLDILEELDGTSRLVIYPSINMVLLGDDVRALLETFREDKNEEDDSYAESEI